MERARAGDVKAGPVNTRAIECHLIHVGKSEHQSPIRGSGGMIAKMNANPIGRFCKTETGNIGPASDKSG